MSQSGLPDIIFRQIGVNNMLIHHRMIQLLLVEHIS